MIHYNPEEHHEEIVKHIAYSIFTGEELDLPYHPPRNDGKPSPVVLTIKDETYVINNEDFLQLSLEADEYAYKRAKLMVQDFEDFTTRQDALDNLFKRLYQTDCCPKNTPNKGNSLYDPDPETSRIDALKEAFTSSKKIRNGTMGRRKDTETR